MKQIFVIALLTASLAAAANPVDVSKARQTALQFIESRSHYDSVMGSRACSAPQLELAYTHEGEAGKVFYVFNQPEDQGYVIVSADDMAMPVLGYTDKGAFDASKLPDGLKDLLNGYEKQITHSVKSNAGRRRASREWSPIEPLVRTQWDQSKPYNNLCPTDENTGERSVTGCGAVAVAQLLYYHQFPKTGRNSISYEWNGKTYAADFSQVSFEWDKMNLTYDSGTPDTDDAVATLLYYSALSMMSEFTSYDTNSWFDTEFLPKYFGYKDEIHFLWKSDTSNDEFENIIYQDLRKGLPVFCWAEASEDWSHIFLIDGCNKDGLFHMNFGWGGSNAGYYVLEPIDLEWINMKTFQCILYNIQPDIPGKWFVKTNDGRFFEMNSVGDIGPDPGNDTDLLVYDTSGNILASGITSVSFVQTNGTLPANSVKGDANGDRKVNAVDITEAVNYIMGKPSKGFNMYAADVNDDGKVNIRDIYAIAAIIIAPE